MILPDKFYRAPRVSTTTMSKKDLQELLKDTNGSIISCGYLWDIKSESLGVGMYKVSLKIQSE